VLFPTVTFAIFFSIVLPLSWLLMPRGTRWRVFMIAASYFFYGYWNPRFVLLIVASTVWNQIWGTVVFRLRNDRHRRTALFIAVAGDLGLLGYFKYAQFFEVSARNALTHAGIHVNPQILQVTLPIGISFFTFQAMSYVIDISRRQIEPVNFLDFAVYISFFPHLVAGPIVRASEFLPQLDEKKDPRKVDTGRAFFLIISGLFKKVVLANFLATRLVDRVFSLPELHNGREILFAIYGYAVQIYCDFSGYTDIAIGLALLLGFRFPQNFNAPYTAESMQDFWRRWHMTLSRWLRDYLYIPLGGNRDGERATYRNLMITMLLGGLWHGAAATFVVWGAIHGVLLAGHGVLRARGLTPSSRVVNRAVTFLCVVAAFVVFRSHGLPAAGDVLGGMVGLGGVEHGSALTALLDTRFALTIGALLVFVNVVPNTWQVRFDGSFAKGLAYGALLAAAILAIAGPSPFLYYQF
jgi:alginate O-acetyltransferase complex protein AlgI